MKKGDESMSVWEEMVSMDEEIARAESDPTITQGEIDRMQQARDDLSDRYTGTTTAAAGAPTSRAVTLNAELRDVDARLAAEKATAEASPDDHIARVRVATLEARRGELDASLAFAHLDTEALRAAVDDRELALEVARGEAKALRADPSVPKQAERKQREVMAAHEAVVAARTESKRRINEAGYAAANRRLIETRTDREAQRLWAKYWADKIAVDQAEAHADPTRQGYVAIDKAKSLMPPPEDFVAKVRAAAEADVGSATDRLLRAAGGEAPE